VGFVPGAARVRQAAHGAARLERGRGTRRAESRGTGKKKGKEGEGAPTGGARLPERGGAGLCGLGEGERAHAGRRAQASAGHRARAGRGVRRGGKRDGPLRAGPEEQRRLLGRFSLLGPRGRGEVLGRAGFQAGLGFLWVFPFLFLFTLSFQI